MPGYGFANELLSGGVMTTPRLNDSNRAFRYQYASSALAADRIITMPLLTGNANFVFDSFLNVFTVTQTITQTAVAGGASALVITPGAHTAVIAEVNDVLVNAHTDTVTGNYATQRFSYIATPTITSVGAQTITTATTFEIQSAPTVAGSAAITAVYGFNFSGGAINIANIAGTSYRPLRIGSHTITLTTATQMTATPSVAALALNIITINQSGGAVIVDSASTLYISGAPTGGAGVTLTSAYAILVDAGHTYLGGRITGAFTSVASTPAETLTGTWYTGGTATTTKPHLLIEPSGTTSTGWSTSGTGLGVNAAAGFVGNLLDLQLAGATKLRIQYDGSLNIANYYVRPGSGNVTFRNDVDSASNFTVDNNGLVTIRGGLIIGTDLRSNSFNFKNNNATSSYGTISTSGGWTLTTIANVGGTTALTITQAAHTAVIAEKPALLVNAATITLADTTTIASYSWVSLNAPTFNGVAAGGAEVITDAATLWITGAPVQGTNITLTSTWALYVAAGNVRLGGNITMSTAASQLVPGATSFSLRNNANNADNLLVSDAGLITLRASATVNPASGVAGFAVVSTALTLGSAGSIIAPFADMANALNDAARDTLAGNVDGAVAIDSVGAGAVFKVWCRVGGAWKSATIA